MPLRRLAPAAIALSALACAAAAHAAPDKPGPKPMSAQDFLAAAAQSDQYEIMAGRDADTQAQDPRVRDFARMMIQDHSATRQGLAAAAARSSLPPPPETVSPDQQRLLGALQSLRGADFDKAYVKQQVLAHQQALTVQQSYAQSGDDPNLRQAAQTAVPVIQRHLQQAQQMQQQMGAGD